MSPDNKANVVTVIWAVIFAIALIGASSAT